MKLVLQCVMSALVLVCCTIVPMTAQQAATDVAFAQPAASVETGTLTLGGDQPLAQWSSAASLPAQRGYIDGAAIDGVIYVFGGLSPTAIEASAYKYDVATNAWSQIASMPKQRSLVMAEAVNGKIYIIGGYSSGNPFTTENAVFEYDPAANTYTTKRNTPFPVFGGASFVHNGRIYVLGGGTTNFQSQSNAIQIYDPATDRWTLSTTFTPIPMRAMTAEVFGNTVYLVGGYQYASGRGTFYPSVYKGVISGDDITWTKIADFPGGSIMRQSGGSDGTKMYIAGGYDTNTNTTSIPTQGTWVFDPSNETWTPAEPKTTGVYYATQMILANGKFYVVGGTGTNGAYLNIVEVFNPGEAASAKVAVNLTSVDTWVKRGTVSQTRLRINSLGGLALNWSAAGSQPWLGASKTSGTIDPLKAEWIMINVDGAQLANGDHSADLTLTTNDPAMPTITIPVTAHVQDEDVDAPLNVLLEEGTGTWCGYCPYGVDSINAVVARYPGRVFVISYHGGSANEPMQTPSTNFWTGITGLTGWPQGSVNRVVFEGETRMAINRGAWNERIAELLSMRRSPVTITHKGGSYNAATKATTLQLEVLFHQRITRPVRLTVSQVQDGQMYPQTFYPPSGGTTLLNPFYHNHTMRLAIPSDAGEPLSTGDPVASQTRMTKTFNFTSVDSTVGTSRLIAYVHESNGATFGQVLQVIELPLSQLINDVTPLPAEASFALHQNYPNPFNPSTTITYDVPTHTAVTLVVTDAFGREVARLADGLHQPGRHTATFNAAALASGSYFVTMRTPSFVGTKSMTLVK